MFQRTLGKQLLLATATVIAATAGQVTIGKSLASGVRIDGGTGLTCSNVLCQAMAGQAFTFTSLMSGGGSTSVAASLGLPTESYMQMMNLSGLKLTTTPAAFTPGADSSQPEEAGSFAMSNGQITAIDTVDLSDSSTRPAEPFSDPIISISFNAHSTSILSDIVSPSNPTLSLNIAGPTASSANSSADGSTADTPLAITFSSAAKTQMGSMSTPEPGTEMLIGIGLVAAGAFARIKRSVSSKS